MEKLEEHFRYDLHSWQQTRLGEGRITLSPRHTLLLSLEDVVAGTYADAQIDDYQHLPRKAFPWQPPLRMEVVARASHPHTGSPSSTLLQGTAGFGFWNHPFSVRGDILMLPEAIWFFYSSPPSNMALVPNVPGWGWKAQVVHSMRPGALAALVPAATSMLWARMSGRTRSASHWLQRLSGASEALLTTPLTTFHTYTLEWQRSHVDFWVDGKHLHHVANPPSRPLGFVAWLDNQYAIATPRGELKFGTVATGSQWLELSSILITPL
jgi:hypothetical protein